MLAWAILLGRGNCWSQQIAHSHSCSNPAIDPRVQDLRYWSQEVQKQHCGGSLEDTRCQGVAHMHTSKHMVGCRHAHVHGEIPMV
eukprot:363362-Chlamydomonas_euryale.AAC.7